MALHTFNDYVENFDSVAYFRARFENLEAADESNCYQRRFQLRTFYDIFEYLNQKTGTVLSVGCGPTVYDVIAASKYTSAVYLADYCPRNVEELQKWWQSPKESELNHSSVFKYCGQLEQTSNFDLIETRTRDAIKAIISCDVLKPGMLNLTPRDNELPKRFDTIVASYCLGAACSTKSDYKVALRNVYNCLNPGGHFLLAASTGFKGNEYKVGPIRFFVKDYGKKDVLQYLQDEGFALVKSVEDCETVYPSKPYAFLCRRD